MNVSECALVAGISHLEVNNDTAFNTPTNGTLNPASKMSSETLVILQEASNKLKEADKGPPKAPKERELAAHQLRDSLLAGTDVHLNPNLCT